jgi:tetratricopeptide (TPR) repeat protein
VDTAATTPVDSITIMGFRALLEPLPPQLERWSKWAGHPADSTLRGFADATGTLRKYNASDPSIADFILGKAYLEKGDLAEAQRHMLVPQRWSSGFFTELIVPREYYLGRIAEAQGDRAAARAHYERFVRWWRDCDLELKPMWEDGRQRLAKVGGEPLAQ